MRYLGTFLLGIGVGMAISSTYWYLRSWRIIARARAEVQLLAEKLDEMSDPETEFDLAIQQFVEGLKVEGNQNEAL